MPVIDRGSPIPLYYQLKQHLLEKIHASLWLPGELIPSEQELQDSYSLSRTTVRQTLADLVNEGYLVRQRGRGTFVAEPKFAYDPTRSLEVNEFILGPGKKLGWSLLGIVEEPATAYVAEQLGLRTGDTVTLTRRLRLAVGDVLGYHFAYVPQFIAQHIDHAALTEGSSHDYLMHVPQMRQPHIERTLEARLAGDLECQLLGTAPGAAVLYLERLTSAPDGKPLEFLLAAFRGDRFKYKISL